MKTEIKNRMPKPQDEQFDEVILIGIKDKRVILMTSYESHDKIADILEHALFDTVAQIEYPEETVH